MQICLYMSLNKTSLGGMDINNLILYIICTYAFYEAMQELILGVSWLGVLWIVAAIVFSQISKKLCINRG